MSIIKNFFSTNWILAIVLSYVNIQLRALLLVLSICLSFSFADQIPLFLNGGFGRNTDPRITQEHLISLTAYCLKQTTISVIANICYSLLADLG